MSFQHVFVAHDNLVDNLKKKIDEMLTIEARGRELRVISVDIPKVNRSKDLRTQKMSKIQGTSYSVPVYANLELKEDGKVLDRAKLKLFNLPQATARGTYIVGGNEYYFPMQKRLIPGVYTREREDGTISSWLNSEKGRNMSVTLRAGGDFVMEVAGSNVNLYALLRGLGVTESTIQKQWGDEVLQRNKSARGANNFSLALQKVYEKLRHPSDEPAATSNDSDLAEWILRYFSEKTQFDAENVELTLGQKYQRISVGLLMSCTAKILGISRGEKNEDNKESLIHNSIYDVSDFVIERINQRQYRYKIERVLTRKLGDRKNRKCSDIWQSDLLQRPIESTFTQTNLSKMPKQNNPMDAMSAFSEVTVMGEGGITSTHQVSRDVRAVDPTHMGFIDPAHTPEGSNIGTTLHLAKSVVKKGKTLYSRVYDVKTGEMVEVNPRQFYKAYVTFPEFFQGGKLKPADDGLVKATHMGEIKRVKPSQVKYAIRMATDMFGVNTIAVPFLSHNNGVRVMTAAKMQSQAKPLKYREEPIVQARISENQQSTIEQIMGATSSPRSPVNGTVHKVSKDEVIILDSKGEKHSVSVAHNVWLNENNYEDTQITVKKGDKVKKGQVIGDTNYTKNGTLALGVNLNTAYIDYKGLNHEDGTVISESAAKKLTSLHAHQRTIPYQDNEVIDKAKFRSYFPSAFTATQLEKLDERGVIKPGQKINQGDPIVVKMREIEEETLSKKLQNISRLLAQDYRDTSEIWSKSTSGVVAEVHERRKDILVVIKTEEKAKIGDKLVGRYGNKSTITSIIADNEMPKDGDGNHMEILIDPASVPGRMNLGQIMETTASKVAAKTGKTYKASPFGGDHTNSILKDLKKHKLKDHGSLFDKDGEVPGVLYGKQYILKLEHQVEKKLSSRGAGPEYSYSLDGQPSRGQGESGRAIGLGEMYALLSHGAKENLKEMYTFKGDRQFESWRAVENGTFLPPPKTPASSERFVNMLRGMGINLVEEDNSIVKMVPFLDRDVKDVSNGAIKDATTLRAKDLKEESGGLFDFGKTGGLIGEKWSHIELEEPMPHPTFEKSILAVTGLKKKDLEDIMSGTKGVLKGEVVKNSDQKGLKTGGGAIKSLLNAIDVKGRIKEIEEVAPTKRATALNKLHRELRILKNFDDNGIALEEMVVSKVPVLPPKFRPIIELPNGDLSVADVNEHYRATILMNNHLKSFKDRPGLRDEANVARRNLYESLRGVAGFSMGLVEKPDVKGIADTISGSSPKYGYFHSKLIKRRQDVSGTAVISPAPELGMDELGVPENMAWNVFRPFIIKELKDAGLTSMNARKEVEDRTKFAKEAMQRAMDQRLVLANRAPTLHRWSMMAFRPRLVAGSAVKVPVEVLGGLGADFDGDSVLGTLSLLDKNGCHTIEIADFPRIEDTKQEMRDGVFEYDVPEGVQVYGYDRNEKRVRPFEVTKFSEHHDLRMVDVKYKSRREVCVSEDHSLFCMDPNTYILDRTKPEESVGLYTPRPKVLDLPKSLDSWRCANATSNPNANRVPEHMPLNNLSGYALGAFVGDGYTSQGNLGLCNIKDKILEKGGEWIKSMGGGNFSVHENHHEFGGSKCFSKKAHWTFSNLGSLLEDWIGRGSANKHLPPFWIYGNEEFRLGLLSGLIDTDGSVCVVKAKAKKKPQIQASYHTKSRNLADEVGLLLASFGIRSNVTEYEKKGETYCVVTISTPDLKPWAAKLTCQHDENLEALQLLQEMDVNPRQDDIVPIPAALADRMRKNVTSKRRSEYMILRKAAQDGHINRVTVLEWMDDERWNVAVKDIPQDLEGLYMEFCALIAADNILWDQVVSVDEVEGRHTAYDLTVPDCLVFMMANTVIVYDTFGIHVPTSPEAVVEAEGMLPSNNLYRPGKMRSALSVEIGKEYMMGLFKLTRPGKTTSKMYKLPEQVVRDAEQKKIRWTDIVSVQRIGRTTAGKIKVNESLPRDMRDYQITLTADEQEKLLVAVEKKHGKEALRKTITEWKHAGRIHVYQSGTSFLLSDMKMLTKEREQLYRQADQEAMKVRNSRTMTQEEKDKKLIEIYSRVDSKIMNMAGSLKNNSTGQGNNIADMVNSGMSKPGKHQLKQIVGSLGLMMDHRQNVMPEPIRGNYAEGLDSSEFFAHMYAQRKGMIDRSQSVSGPGMLSKELTNSATTQKITMSDCGTTNGRYYAPDRHLLDRVMAEDIAGVPRNTVIDEGVIEKLKKSGKDKVKVRSILTCNAHPGICAKCFGIDEHGNFPQLGKNIGVSEIQAVTERSVQLPMKSFHCISRHSLVVVKDPSGNIITPTHEELFHMVPDTPATGHDWEEKYPTQDWMVWDINGWTQIDKIGRHKKNRPMVAVKTDMGHILVCQDNHPIMVQESKNFECGSCSSTKDLVVSGQRGDKRYIKCAGCDNITKTTKDEWNASRPLMKYAGEVSTSDVLTVDHGPLGMGSGWSGDFSPYILGVFLAEGSFSIRDEGEPSVNKRLPKDFLVKANFTQMGEVISGLIDGDGCISWDGGRASIEISTTSLAIVQSVKVMCDLLQIPCNVSVCTSKKLTRHQGYVVRIHPTQAQADQHFSDSIKVRSTSFPESRKGFCFESQSTGRVFDLYQEKEEWVYDLTTMTGTFYSGSVWNHNTGGVATADHGLANAFDRALQILRMPEYVRDKAILAEVSGMVSRIEPSGYGGHNVTIGAKVHKVPKKLELQVKVGSQVQKGQPISSGFVKPQELLKLKGIKAVQEQMTEDLHSTFASAGVKLHKRTYEVPVKMLTEQVRIVDPGDNEDFVAGDHTTMARADAWNADNPAKNQIKYMNILPGSLFAPHKTDDWARRMALNRIKGTLQDGAAQGFKSDRLGTSPFADLALGPGTRIPKPGEVIDR